MKQTMKPLSWGRWTLASDAETTRSAYAAVASGGPELCNCDPCLNFATQRHLAYPAEALALFEQLGIDFRRESEIYHMARLESGKHLYGGWFHFVGEIVSGLDASKKIAENSWQPDLQAISEEFNMGFTTRTALVRKSFESHQLVQLEFTTHIPWVLDAKEPS